MHEKIYDQFRDVMVEFTKSIKTGDGFGPDVTVGSIQNSMQYVSVPVDCNKTEMFTLDVRYEKVKDIYSEISKCS